MAARPTSGLRPYMLLLLHDPPVGHFMKQNISIKSVILTNNLFIYDIRGNKIFNILAVCNIFPFIKELQIKKQYQWLSESCSSVSCYVSAETVQTQEWFGFTIVIECSHLSCFFSCSFGIFFCRYLITPDTLLSFLML